MAKRREDYEAIIARKIREGRGLGEFRHYKPWLYIREVPSLGRSHIKQSATVGRAHHLLSDLEEIFFLHVDFSPHFVDIREQFPLFPREETAKLAADLSIKHPAICGSNIVLTEDFLLTSRDASMPYQALQVKYAKELNDERVREKLELQRRYFTCRGIPWRLITERDFSTVVIRNLKWLRKGALEIFPEATTATFKEHIKKPQSTGILRDAIIRAGDRADLDKAQAALMFQRLVWTHEIELDMNVLIDLSMPFSSTDIRVADPEQTHARTA